jgi:hypothetical protein
MPDALLGIVGHGNVHSSVGVFHGRLPSDCFFIATTIRVSWRLCPCKQWAAFRNGSPVP